MIEIFIQTNTNVTARSKVAVVPQIGERIIIRGIEYHVTKVVHDIDKGHVDNQAISVFAAEVPVVQHLPESRTIAVDLLTKMQIATVLLLKGASQQQEEEALCFLSTLAQQTETNDGRRCTDE